MQHLTRVLIFAAASVVLATEQEVFAFVDAEEEFQQEIQPETVKKLNLVMEKLFIDEPDYEETYEEQPKQPQLVKLEEAMTKLFTTEDELEQHKLRRFVKRDLKHLRRQCGRDMATHCLKEMEAAVEQVVQKQPTFPRMHVFLVGVQCLDKKFASLSSSCKTSIATLPNGEHPHRHHAHDPRAMKFKFLRHNKHH